MNRTQDLAMRRYAESARAHYDQHPEDEVALHERDLSHLDIGSAAKDHAIKHGMVGAIAHLHSNPDVHHSVSKMDDASQIRALEAIHNAEGQGRSVNSEGEYENENERTDNYLRQRESDGRGKKGRGTKYGRGY